MRTIVVTVEGVLRKLTDGQRINEGVEFLLRLTNGYEATHPFNAVYLTAKPAKEVEEWLNSEDIGWDLVLGAQEDRVAQLRKIRYEWGYPVDFVIEPDPAIAANLTREGYTTLLFLHPHYAKAEWRPDHQFAARSFADIKAMHEQGLTQRMSDSRLRSAE